MSFVPPISRASSISIYELIARSRHGCGYIYVLETHSERLETLLDPLERRSREKIGVRFCSLTPAAGLDHNSPTVESNVGDNENGLHQDNQKKTNKARIQSHYTKCPRKPRCATKCQEGPLDQSIQKGPKLKEPANIKTTKSRVQEPYD